MKRLLGTKSSLWLTICWSHDDLRKSSSRASVTYPLLAVIENETVFCSECKGTHILCGMGCITCDWLVTIILSLTACWPWYEKWLNFLKKLYWHSVWCRKGLWDYLLEKWHLLPIAHSDASWLYIWAVSLTNCLLSSALIEVYNHFNITCPLLCNTSKWCTKYCGSTHINLIMLLNTRSCRKFSWANKVTYILFIILLSTQYTIK